MMSFAPVTKRNSSLKQGFTLIELLVVIAIIGILSSVVLAALGNARTKGADSTVKSNLVNARPEAELFYNANQTYDLVCATSGTYVIGDSVNAAEIAFDNSPTVYADGTAVTSTGGQCHDSAGAWAAEVPLRAGGYFCVDSTNRATTTLTAIAGGVYACP